MVGRRGGGEREGGKERGRQGKMLYNRREVLSDGGKLKKLQVAIREETK